MMLLAHIAGMPFEELLTPLASAMPAVGVLVLAIIASHLRRHRRTHKG